ncbi:MAG: iron-sulfur cluster carrier protein ApbC [Gammaproteobacteria bacterium]|jgi:ATP-binding protein involved in chromosome partitioning|nr:iron-sulfur cluster carrier protein ApbC [Gammaproteobacteria bacterium]
MNFLPNVSQRSVTVLSEADVNKFLNSIELEAIGQSLGSIARVLKTDVSGTKASAIIELRFPAGEAIDAIKAQIEIELCAHTGASVANVSILTKISSHAVQGNLKRVPGIKNIIAIASGKGGVGKSTVAVNVALALSASGAAVGVLDADIYGPSQPQMLGLSGEQPVSEDGKSMLPLEGHGLKVMSVGFLVNPDQPMVWRGPMVTSALNQLMHQTTWGELDYLIVDMPPGTGDIQLTLSQKVPVSGVVIVTTPQNIATLDARKGLAMFRKVSIPVLGVVENMSTHICSSCGHAEAIFGSGGADKMVEDFEIPLLGQFPLVSSIRKQTDSGTPTVLADPDSAAAKAYRDAALQIAVAQASQRSDYSSKFGKIVVEGNI